MSLAAKYGGMVLCDEQTYASTRDDAGGVRRASTAPAYVAATATARASMAKATSAAQLLQQQRCGWHLVFLL